MQTIDFLTTPLAEPIEHRSPPAAAYRDAVVTGDSTDQVESFRPTLLQVMSRTERPRQLAERMNEKCSPRPPTLPEDLLGYVTLRALAKHVGRAPSVDYWKSAPYFVNFMDGYKLADQVRAALKDPRQRRRRPAAGPAQRLDPDALPRYDPIDLGNRPTAATSRRNGRAGWWQLLWMPPHCRT